MNEILLSAFAGLSLGILGSFHCIGMCGPIALALPVHTLAGWKKFSSILLYNTGRVATYCTLGFLFGLLGSTFRIWGIQQVATIGAGVLILLLLFSKISFAHRIPFIRQFNGWLHHHLGRLLRSPQHPTAYFSIGLLNGLLPCGLVYVAIAAALATTNALSGTVLMMLFGLGTFPAMAGMMIFGHLISLSVRQKINKAVPYVIGVMAFLLIFRGLNLGIPYLSPAMSKDQDKVECCHMPK